MNMHIGMLTGFVVCLMLATAVTAKPDVTQTEQQQSYGSSEQQRVNREENKHTLTDAERSLARQWSLTDADWLKYKAIMAGPRGIWSPNLDPLTALGIHATTDSERDYYAEIWTRVEMARTEGELAFERARAAAARRIAPDTPVIKRDHQLSASPAAGAPPQHFALFTRQLCNTCLSLVNTLTTGLRSVDMLDIYVTDARTDDDVREFALRNGIDVERVKKGQITLNRENASKLLAEFGGPALELPITYGKVEGSPQWVRMH